MIRAVTALALLLSAPLSAQEQAPPTPQLGLEQQTALRCSAAFAIVAQLQAAGMGDAFPQVGDRGREFFVRSTAQLMDDTGATREQITGMVRAEVDYLGEDIARLTGVMPACLSLLDASGL